MRRFLTAALSAVLLPASLAAVVAARYLTLDDFSFDLDPFEVELQLLQRSDDALA